MKQQARQSEFVKALCLFSGSLDSALAIRMTSEQGVKTAGIYFVSPFSFPSGDHAAALKKFCSVNGFDLTVADVAGEWLRFLVSAPSASYSPASIKINSQTFIIRKAAEYLKSESFSFLVTGEAVRRHLPGFKRDDLKEIAKKSGLRELVLRPLSARLLPITAPERRGWLKRKLLCAISDESPLSRIALAKSLGLDPNDCPGAPKSLSDAKLAEKIGNYLNRTPKQNLRADDLRLTLASKAFRLPGGSLLAVARNPAEGAAMKSRILSGDLLATAVGGIGPAGLLRGAEGKDDIELAAALFLKYCSKKNPPDKIRFASGANNAELSVEATPASEETLRAWRL